MPSAWKKFWQPRRRTEQRQRRRCSAARASDNVHLLVVCTAERGLCGAFNSSIVRLAREKAMALMAQGKTVKILCVGKKAHDILKRQFGNRSSN